MGHKQRKVIRREPKSDDPYLKLLVKVRGLDQLVFSSSSCCIDVLPTMVALLFNEHSCSCTGFLLDVPMHPSTKWS